MTSNMTTSNNFNDTWQQYILFDDAGNVTFIGQDKTVASPRLDFTLTGWKLSGYGSLISYKSSSGLTIQTDYGTINLLLGDVSFANTNGNGLHIPQDGDGIPYFDGGLGIDEVQVLTSQQPSIAALSGSPTTADIVSKINEIIIMLRTHGLIASP